MNDVIDLRSNWSTTPPRLFSSSVNQWRFIILESEVSIVTVIVIYLIIAFAVYEYKKKRIEKKSKGAFRPKTILGRKWKAPTFVFAMRLELLISLVFLLARFICEHCELLMQYLKFSSDFCNSLSKAKMLVTTVNVTSVYIFLWTRQRCYYEDPVMKHLSNKATRMMSSLSLLFLFVGNFVGVILFMFFRNFHLSDAGCVNDVSSDAVAMFLPWLWVASNSFVFQVMLFVLFIYPLVRHKSFVPTGNGFYDFLPLIKRTTIITAVCIVSDLITFVLIIFARDENEIIPTLVYDASSIINVVSVFMSFGDWRVQLQTPITVCSHQLV